MNISVLVLLEDAAYADLLCEALQKIYGEQLILWRDVSGIPPAGNPDFVFVTYPEPFFNKYRLFPEGITASACVIALCPEENEPSPKLMNELGIDDVIACEELGLAVVRRSLKRAARNKDLARELKSTNRFFYSMFNDAPSPMWLMDVETKKFVLSNKAACQWYGYTREEFREMTAFDIRPPEDHGQLEQTMLNRPERQVFDCGNWRHIRKNGQLTWVRIYSQETEWKGRKCRMILAVNEDERVRSMLNNKALAEQLDGQRRQLDGILSSLGEVVWSCNIQDFELTYINDACYRAYGYKAEELLGQTPGFFDLLHEEDKKVLDRSMDELFRHGSASCAYRLHHKDGSLRHFISNVSLQYDEQGNQISMTGVDVDITEQVRAEKKMREKTEEVANILESITDSFFALDDQWRYTYANKEYERLQQSSRDQLIGSNYWERFPQLVSSVFYREFHKAVREKVSVHFTAYAPYLEKWLSVNAYPNNKGLAVYFKDITMQRRMEEQQLMNEQNLKALINNTEDMIWSLSTDWRLISLNQVFQQRMAGLTGEKPEPGSVVFHEKLDQKKVKHWRKIYRRVFRGESLRFMEKGVGGNIDGCYEIRINPIIGQDGTVIGASCFCRDVTSINTYLMAIEEQNEKLKEIAWIHSHKIRGPVASLLGMVDVLNQGVLEEEEKTEFLCGIETKCRELDVLIHDINKSASLPLPAKGV